jgi:PAS domain S-box-containing protein
MLEAHGLGPSGAGGKTVNDPLQPPTSLHANVDAAAALAAIVESSDDAIYSKDSATVITSWNRSAERLYGYSSVEAVGQPLAMLVPEWRKGEELRILQRILRGERVDHFETQRVRKDGRVVDVSITVSPVRDAQGEIVAASVSARDVTVLKEIRKGHERLAALVEWSDDAIYTKDANAIITSWNPAAERLYGYSAGEAVGRPIAMLLPPARMGEDFEIMRRILRRERVDHFETERVTKDGRIVRVSISVSPVKDESGKIIEASIIARDITEQQRARLALAEAREARAAVKATQEFVAMATHDLRGPLTVISGLAQTLTSDWSVLDEERKLEFTKAIERSGDRMSRLVGDLLIVARAEARELKPAREQVAAAMFLEDLRSEFPGVKTVLPSDEVTLTVDRGHLHRIMTNYIVNAYRYGEQPIEISASRNHEAVRFVVADSGAGVPDDMTALLFSKFARGSNARSEGSGLGLAIVRGLAEANHGRAWYEPKAPTGSRFCVQFPVLRSSED